MLATEQMREPSLVTVHDLKEAIVGFRSRLSITGVQGKDSAFVTTDGLFGGAYWSLTEAPQAGLYRLSYHYQPGVRESACEGITIVGLREHCSFPEVRIASRDPEMPAAPIRTENFPGNLLPVRLSDPARHVLDFIAFTTTHPHN